MKTPSHLSKSQKTVYKQIVSLLSESGTIADASPAVIEGLAVQICRARMADREVDEHGITYECGKNNWRQANPAIAISSTAWKIAKTYMETLGMTPQAKSKLSVASNSDAQSALDDLLEG